MKLKALNLVILATHFFTHGKLDGYLKMLTAGAHGFDNTVTTDAIAALGDSARGIAVVPPDISDEALRVLDAKGIRGLRLSTLLSGGVGLTPTISMLRPALESGRQVHFIHGALNSKTHAFKSMVDQLGREYDNLNVSYCYSEPLPEDQGVAAGFLDQSRLESLLPLRQNPDIYFLGPKAFMQSCYHSLTALAVPKEQIRYEFFGPLEAIEG